MSEPKPRRAGAPSGGRLTRVVGGRRHVTKVLMTDDEWVAVQARAIAMGVSVPRALIEAATGTPPQTRTERVALYQELMGLRRLVANVTNNVNQIAKTLNAGVDVPNRQIAATLERAAVAMRRVEEFAEDVRP
ncbi:hypothetical protein QMK19_28965 [Streptomyces sp. H10-C2]|uniref:hypothetical protein n=1 Tax=unclassified Streptomyces TaxID=2593676 RepID=UPI0024BA2B0A|nr:MULTISPECIES: hypothetical protein [unclassified Streptomyces]MDJ0344242.1 hypothetical protein [Streptomyces sp. PH10-H1]MDJ0373580.1 hypothetical protein [Streptomyces sp. H10-C2]